MCTDTTARNTLPASLMFVALYGCVEVLLRVLILYLIRCGIIGWSLSIRWPLMPTPFVPLVIRVLSLCVLCFIALVCRTFCLYWRL